MNFLSELGQCKISVWKGDICTLRIGAIVNAANSHMLGCFSPSHPCIDNAIHDKAGPRLRAACRDLMRAQGTLENTGCAKITPAFCLPSEFVLHTVGPIYPEHGEREDLLASCYTECLKLAQEKGIRTVAFCCISTGVFGYPILPATLLALRTVKNYLSEAVVSTQSTGSLPMENTDLPNTLDLPQDYETFVRSCLSLALTEYTKSGNFDNMPEY
eukprot:TRINITY_DN11778_c0_g1_i1.p1 TRINITY_DN11778_c0_g1~~TRINITY_DN11778_c0_g1_i1.p1  ORF type:complete len:215 (+),score=27.84 TRINITY_DN11778_c0_g1_i1:542-1186(+)